MVKRDAVYDLKGLNCPLPVLKAKKRLAAMHPGSRLWPGIETAEYQPGSLFRGLDGGKNQSLPLEPDFDRSRA